MTERIPVLEIREADGGREFLVPRAGGGQAWVDSVTIAQDTLDKSYSFYITNHSGQTETFHVVLQRDFTWTVRSFPDAELDSEDPVIMDT
jgi:hypothetical protein